MIKAAQDISAPGYSYNTMLAREVDLEFLTICQAQLPQNARVLDLVDVNAARPYYASIEYYLYPRYTVTLDRRDRSDDSIARQIAKYHITYVVLWDPTAYQHSLLLHDTQFFEIHDYGRGRVILVVKSIPPQTGS